MENYLILSNDIITINEKIKEILSKLNLTEENLIKFNMNEVYLETVMEELNTYGLFVTNKVVVMYSCDFLSGDKKRNMLSQNEKLLEEYIKNPNEVNSLIIVCEKLDERKKITKLLKERFTVIDENISIENKIKNNLEGFNMNTKTINYLKNYLNNDNIRIMNELEKLKTYKYEEKEITIDDINSIVLKEFDDNIFSLINYILKKDVKKSFEVYNELISRGEDITKIVITVADQFRLIYKVKILINDGKNKDTITSMLGIHPYRVKLAMEASYSFTNNDLVRYLKSLGDIDINIKTGVSANNFGFDLFLLNL